MWPSFLTTDSIPVFERPRASIFSTNKRRALPTDLHVISEGIAVGEAGRKYVALILDYGFYTGIRAAQSVDLFNKQTERVAYKDLRKLPVLEPKLPSDAC